MIRPLVIDSISSLARDIYNAVYSKKYSVVFSLFEEKIYFQFKYPNSLKPPYILLALKTENGEIFIVLDRNLLNFINQYYGIDVSLLDKEIKLGLFKAIWMEVKDKIQSNISSEVYDIEYREEVSDIVNNKCCINFVLKFSSGLEVNGVGSGSEIVLAQLLPELISKMQIKTEETFLNYPCNITILIGKTDISLSELACIEKDDILLIEKLYFQDNRLILSTGPFLFEGEIDKEKIIIRDMVKEVEMSDEAVENKEININEIPITLSFSIGKMEISFEELKNIQPGYVFNLDKPIGSYIEIRANGKLLGSGELVEIEGKIGVRLKELNFSSISDASKENPEA